MTADTNQGMIFIADNIQLPQGFFFAYCDNSRLQAVPTIDCDNSRLDSSLNLVLSLDKTNKVSFVKKKISNCFIINLYPVNLAT